MSKRTIYLVTYVTFDGYDYNLYSHIETFADEQQARQQFERDCTTALADARNEDGCESEDEWYSVEENKYDDTYYVSRSNYCYYTEVKLIRKEIEINL